MSTDPSESTGPAVPEAAEPAAASPENSDGKPTTADQAKADGAAVAISALKGAVTGGATGAAVGALKGAVKTKTGRNVAIAVIVTPILAVSLLTGLIFNAAQAISATPGGRAAIAQTAALSAFENKDDLNSIQDASTQGGVPWQVVAGIYQAAKSKTGAKGSGPFGIDMAAASGEISEDDANDFDKAALFVARKLKAASATTIDSLSNPTLDAGYMDTRGDKGESVLKPIDTDEAKAARDLVKEAYVKAIIAIPLEGNPGTAEAAFASSLLWMAGAAPDKCSPSNVVTVGDVSNADLNAKKKIYAQAIIDQVASKGMPENAAVIALATALQESGLRMYWNSHVPGSKELADGGPEGGFDLGPGKFSYSVGLFQQQVNGTMFSWGTVQDAMNPSKSADMFLDRLMTINGWQNLPVTVAAQSVQGSAFPSAYADDEVAARTLVGELKPKSGSYGTTTNTAPSTPGSGPGAPAGAAVTSCQSGGVGTGTVGAGDDYPYKNPVGVFTTEADPWSEFKRQCVSFVAWRMNLQMGWKEGQEYPFTPAKLGLGLFGSAIDWKDTVASKFPMDSTPKVGAVAWFDANIHTGSTWTGDAGHVAVVSAVNGDGTIDVEEYNFNPLAYGTRKIPASDVSGFIHVADISK
ncbi:CHAP domain-containing protein [Arthrobacter terrae]|nr:CHAP domain-containing protein [Arthrobacter terrae]